MKQDRITKNVSEQIKSGNIKIRSKYVVAAEKLGLGSALVLTVVLAAIAINLVFYMLDATNNLDIVSLGSNGILAFLESFPYIPLSIGIALIVLSGYLLKRFDVSYKAPIMVGVGLLIAIPILGGLAVHSSGLNQAMERKVEQGGMPPLRPLFGAQGPSIQDHNIVGNIQNFENDKIIISTDHSTTNIFYNDQTSMQSIDAFSVDDLIRAIGKFKDGDFYADALINLSQHRKERLGAPVPPPFCKSCK